MEVYSWEDHRAKWWILQHAMFYSQSSSFKLWHCIPICDLEEEDLIPDLTVGFPCLYIPAGKNRQCGAYNYHIATLVGVPYSPHGPTWYGSMKNRVR